MTNNNDNENSRGSNEGFLIKVIGILFVFLGTVATGVFTNWDKIFPKSDNPAPTTTPAISLSITSPSPSISASTPERSLNIFAQSLTNRDFDKLAKIFPNGNVDSQRA